MFGSEKRVLAKHYLDQGLSRQAVADLLGISRRTLHRWEQEGLLEGPVPERKYVRREPRPTKLDPYKSIIEERLTAYPELSAVRLLDEVRAAGYTGGYTQLQEHVLRVRPRPPKEPVVRFETAPGKQAQVDFGKFRLPWGVRHCLLVVLGYSRLLWISFVRRQDMRTLFLGLEEAFVFFGGVTEEVLFDQMKTVITRDDRMNGGQLVKNAEFQRFAAHWNFTPRACRPYRAQTKGKVERPVRYVRGNFFYGRDFVNDADLNEQARIWLDRKANVRVHYTTRERPYERYLRDEQGVLRPVAERPYTSLMLQPQTELALPTVLPPRRLGLAVERRPLCAYADLAERAP
jgi:transposase